MKLYLLRRIPLTHEARPLTDDERALANAAKNIDEKFPRPTEADVKALLDKITTQQDEDGEAPSSEQEAVKELG